MEGAKDEQNYFRKPDRRCNHALHSSAIRLLRYTFSVSTGCRCRELRCLPRQADEIDDGPGMHASVHAKKGIDKCSSCHDPAALKEAHANVKPGESKFVKARRYPKDFCLKCHGKPADLAKRTAGCKLLTDTKGNVVNPHEIPQNPKHEKMDECFMCHKEHKAKPDIKNYCMSCHHTGEFITCSKCHS